MGGYGFYVWSAYGVAAVVLITNALLPVFRFRALRREIERGGER
ncbi:MAG: heme exporter protein CcmD [Nitrococcus sp.]|nr:heme exporter protein CcmD [Nitrococcus sp.]